MAENPRPLTPDQLIAAWIVEAQGGNAFLAVATLEALVRQYGLLLSEDGLFALARLEAFAGASPDGLWPGGPVNTSALDTAVEQVMRRRGIWRKFRVGEWKRTWLGAARWMLALLAMAVGLITAVFVVVAGGSHILHWLGF